jgi:HTH-type transcriptional regulator/antitoxin HipB
MSELETYIERRKRKSPQFARNFESGYRAFEFSVMLRQAREAAGVTQETVARKLRTKKSAISRIENHAEDIRLSTLEKYANALGMRIRVQLTRSSQNPRWSRPMRERSGALPANPERDHSPGRHSRQDGACSRVVPCSRCYRGTQFSPPQVPHSVLLQDRPEGG